MPENTNKNDSSAFSAFTDAIRMFAKVTWKVIKLAFLPIVWAFKILNMFFSVFKIIMILLAVIGFVALSGGQLGSGGELAGMVELIQSLMSGS